MRYLGGVKKYLPAKNLKLIFFYKNLLWIDIVRESDE